MRSPRALPRFTLPVVSLLALTAPLAQAQPQSPDSGDTAWLLVATAFVLMMIIPGLALFYGGLVRSKNILSVLMQCFAITALVSLLWVFYGYSLAFDTTGMVAGEFGLASVVGGLATLGLIAVGRDALTGTIPESLFVAFQLTPLLRSPRP